MGISSDIKVAYVSADTTGLDADAVCESQTPAAGGVQNLTIDGAETAGGNAFFVAAKIISITCAADESARTFTITGTDVNGNAIEETIAGIDTATTNGAKYFKTITQVSVDDDTAGAVTVGITTASLGVFYAGRARLRGLYVVRTGTAGLISLNTGAEPSTAINRFRFSNPAAVNTSENVIIPDNGVVFEDGIYIDYLSTGSLQFSSITVMYS
jgi:hypothetical protein